MLVKGSEAYRRRAEQREEEKKRRQLHRQQMKKEEELQKELRHQKSGEKRDGDVFLGELVVIGDLYAFLGSIDEQSVVG